MEFLHRIDVHRRQDMRVDVQFCLGTLDREGESGYHFLRELATGVQSPLIRFVAALAVVKCDRNDIPRDVIDLLIQVGMHERTIDAISFPWQEWRTDLEAMRALQWLRSRSAQYAIQELLAALRAYLARLGQEMGLDLWHYHHSKELLSLIGQWAKEQEEYKGNDPAKHQLFERRARFSRELFSTVDQTVCAVTYLAFRREKISEGASFQELSLEQQQVITILAECGLAWHCRGGWRDQKTGEWRDRVSCVVNLRQLGLPETREGLHIFLQGDGRGDTETIK